MTATSAQIEIQMIRRAWNLQLQTLALEAFRCEDSAGAMSALNTELMVAIAVIGAPLSGTARVTLVTQLLVMMEKTNSEWDKVKAEVITDRIMRDMIEKARS